jgi:hypothetical protein
MGLRGTTLSGGREKEEEIMSTITSWHSYPKIWNLGHSAIKELISDPVVIEEKVDGSQFSFGVFDGEIKCRSKGQQLIIDAPEKMFVKAIETVKELAPLLREGYTYRAEYLQKPKHNTLRYSRVPNKHLIIFDICPSEESYLPYDAKLAEATRVGLEVVPCFFQGTITTLEMIQNFIGRESILGTAKIEGVVIKNYSKFGPDKKVLLGKLVSDEFKEVHTVDWKNTNPKQSDVLEQILNRYKSEARFQKGVQHLKENNLIEGTPRDIGKLVTEVKKDALAELEDLIKNDLFNWAWPQIERRITNGLPEWYLAKLAEGHFEKEI